MSASWPASGSAQVCGRAMRVEQRESHHGSRAEARVRQRRGTGPNRPGGPSAPSLCRVWWRPAQNGVHPLDEALQLLSVHLAGQELRRVCWGQPGVGSAGVGARNSLEDGEELIDRLLDPGPAFGAFSAQDSPAARRVADQ